MTAVIDIEKVSKRYRSGDPLALNQVSLEIAAGSRVGLVGANGSGKTTLMRLLLNFIRPDSGCIRVLGEENLEMARRHMGFVPERQQGMENFTPHELLRFSGTMRGLSPALLDARIETLLEFAVLKDVSGELLADFSKGMSQRVQICLALLHEPQILLLDEPLSGLDPSGQQELLALLQQLQDITIVYASHQMDEIERCCDTVVVMHGGQIRKQLNMAEIAQEIYVLTLDAAAEMSLGDFSQFDLDVRERSPDTITVALRGSSQDFQALSRILESHRLPILRLRSRGVLEELYQQYSRT